MKDIIIVCAGSYAREALSLLDACNYQADLERKERPYRMLGFLDDNLHALDGMGIPYRVIGRISDWHPNGDERYVIGAAMPATKAKLVTLLRERGCRFETLIAPWSIVAKDCAIGEGCFITAYYISAAVKIGDFVNVNGSMITPGAVIDDFSTTTGFTVVEAAYIGKRVFVGSNAVVTAGVRIEDDAQVSAGSIVTSDVPAGVTVFGVPAKAI